MSLRWTEEEAKRAGFRKTTKGDWIYERQVTVRVNHPSSLPQSKCDLRGEAKRPAKAKKAPQADSKGTNSFTLEVISYSHRHRDPDNLCPKWYVDELVRAGILPDDSSRFIRAITKSVVKITKEETEKTIIRVYNADTI